MDSLDLAGLPGPPEVPKTGKDFLLLWFRLLLRLVGFGPNHQSVIFVEGLSGRQEGFLLGLLLY